GGEAKAASDLAIERAEARLRVNSGDSVLRAGLAMFLAGARLCPAATKQAGQALHAGGRGTCGRTRTSGRCATTAPSPGGCARPLLHDHDHGIDGGLVVAFAVAEDDVVLPALPPAGGRQGA